MKNKQTTMRNLLLLAAVSFFTFSCEKESSELTDYNAENADSGTTEQQEYFFKTDDSLNVSAADATKFALNVVNNGIVDDTSYSAKSTSVQTEIDEIITIPDENYEPAMYVINYIDGGFVVLSATEKEHPILAFSEENSFSLEDPNAGIVGWFNQRVNRIQHLKADKTYETPVALQAKWKKIKGEDISNSKDGLSAKTAAVQSLQYGPLLNTAWGQGDYYNEWLHEGNVDIGGTCDTYANGNPPVGCVGIALAQVLRYHAHGSYSWGRMTYQLDESTYFWNRFFTSLYIYQISELVNTDYACEGSSVFSTSIIPDAIENDSKLLYANGGTYHGSLTTDDAELYVKADIISGRPVIMDGCDEYEKHDIAGIWTWYTYDNCHAWVCDGYQISGTVDNEFYHMNWGWDGFYNGWYMFDDIDNSSSDFQYNRNYITGISPN